MDTYEIYDKMMQNEMKGMESRNRTAYLNLKLWQAKAISQKAKAEELLVEVEYALAQVKEWELIVDEIEESKKEE